MVRYEDLVENPATELRRMLSFLGRDASPATLECVLRNGEGPYHRRQRPLPFDPFTREQRLIIGTTADRVYSRLGLTRPPPATYSGVTRGYQPVLGDQ